MSGVPSWCFDAKGLVFIIDGKRCTLKDAYCVAHRGGMHNSDELVLVTDKGEYNTVDHMYEATPATRKALNWPESEQKPVQAAREYKKRKPWRVVRAVVELQVQGDLREGQFVHLIDTFLRSATLSLGKKTQVGIDGLQVKSYSRTALRPISNEKTKSLMLRDLERRVRILEGKGQ